MELVFLITGLIVGAVIAYLYFKNKLSAPETKANEQLILLDKEKSILEERLKNKEKETNNLIANLEKEYDNAKSEIISERDITTQLHKRLAKAEEVFNSQNEKLTTQKREIEELQKKFTLEFENIANKILDEKSKKFTEQNKTNLDIILNPLKDRIKEFESKIDKNYQEENKERISLKTEIKLLTELNKQISSEANNLATALKGDNKKQGNWGEVILEKILERSGLVKDREYKTQVTTNNEDGKIIKPDVVIYLPDNKHIVVDSKVSLIAYEACVNAKDDVERELYKREHLLSLKNHIKQLSEKKYHSAVDFDTPDFVMLFVPIESSFSIAIEADKDLFSFAWEKQIVIVSPSTLLATLRTIASLWKQERQNKNVQEIARIGGSLHDEIARLSEDMKEVEKHLLKSQNAWSSAYKRLTTGKGNLVNTANKIKELGGKTSKKLIDEMSEENTNEDLLIE